jgi:hypothetical protein
MTLSRLKRVSGKKQFYLHFGARHDVDWVQNSSVARLEMQRETGRRPDRSPKTA